MSIRIEGDAVVSQKLNKLIKLVENPRKPMTLAVAHLHNKMAIYPPQKAGSWYRRTGTLGRRWTHVVENGGKRGVVGNNTIYAPQVQGEGMQARVHRGRWQTDKQVATRELDTIIGFFEDAIWEERK